MKQSSPQIGFTLVELAIVLMIIGLLIGGILKGQELIQNARITAYIKQVRSYDVAAISFLDSYGVLPGDIMNPSTRLPNCMAANCNISGNGDGRVSPGTTSTDEANTFWLHLGAANLVSSVDMNSTWTSSNYTTGYAPSMPLGGNNRILHYTTAPNSTSSIDGRYGHHFFNTSWDSAGAAVYVVPTLIIGRLDLKIDDGHPYKGDLKVQNSTSGIAYGQTDYSSVVNNNILGSFVIKAGF
jgi:prepilin-type N-terminal cleavage/methylation domain-containing protein